MNQDNTDSNLPGQEDPTKGKLPAGINVLTILTFIGCGVGALFTMFMSAINDFFLKYIDKALNSGKDFSAKELADMEKGKASIELVQQHIIPLTVVGAIGIILCVLGALWMRKLKKDGYWLYIAGELAPVIGSVVIMGTGQYNSIGSIVGGFLIPVVFVVLYTFQRKHLVN